MKIKPGWTNEEALAALSPDQTYLLQTVEHARDEEPYRIREALNVTREAVRQALAAGVPARLLADLLGVSAARVYQMRDQATAYEAEPSVR